ncbi:MAG: hypothetical protein GY796_19785, partial [Chloroflexi bacterium]|nr:hypothetical protein [Chloroflexota bacterium]
MTLDNFFDYAISVEAAQNREIAAEREKNYASMMLDFINEDNYPTGQCGMISADTLDLGLQTGLLQAPQITVIDKRYEMTGKCRTKIVNGTCRIDEFDGQKVIDEIDRVNRVREKAPWYFLKDVSMADDASFITEVAEDMTSVVDDFRKHVGITAFDNKKVLLVDFGSTFTKVGLLDTSSDEFS